MAKTKGLTAEEAQAALPGKNINKVCHAYISPTGTADVLYDLPEDVEPPKAEKPKKAKAKAEGSPAAA